MKIMLAGQAYFREDNGQAVFTVRIARGLAAAGHQVLALAPNDEGKPGPVKDKAVQVWKIATLALPHNVNISLFPGREIKKALLCFSPDIIHLQDHYFICRALFRAATARAIPVVGSNHFLPDNLTANLPVPAIFKRPVNYFLWQHMLLLYNRLAAVSTPTKTAAAILEQQGILPPVTPVSCGIDTSRFHPLAPGQRAEPRIQFGLDPEAIVFIFVGRLDNEKGLEIVVRAFARLKNPDACLVLAGRGSLAGHLKNLCRSLGIERQVRFPGYIQEKDLPRLLAAADCFVMAGFAELQSIATLEAMACGLPVLAANARALPELVADGENGFLFTPHSVESLYGVMKKFLAATTLWQQWGENSREKARRHAIENTVQAFERWYTTICGNQEDGPARNKQ